MNVRSCAFAVPMIAIFALGCSEDKPAPAAGSSTPVGPVAAGTTAKGSKAKPPKVVNKNLGPEGIVD